MDQILKLYEIDAQGDPIGAYRDLQTVKQVSPTIYEAERKIFKKYNPNFRANLSPSDYKYAFRQFTYNGFNTFDGWDSDKAHSGWKKYGWVFGELSRFQKAFDLVKSEGDNVTKAEFTALMDDFGKIQEPPNHVTNIPLEKERDVYLNLRDALNEWGSNHDFADKNLWNRVKDSPHKVGKGIQSGIDAGAREAGKIIGDALKGVLSEPILMIGAVLIVFVVLERV